MTVAEVLMTSVADLKGWAIKPPTLRRFLTSQLAEYQNHPLTKGFNFGIIVGSSREWSVVEMITMKDIIREGHPTLSLKAEEVAIPLSEEDIKLMKDMLQYIKNSQNEQFAAKHNLRESVGLAAPQLNILKRIIAVHTEDEKGEPHSYVLANPKIISHSEELTYLPNGEGCLSIDREVEGLVPRHRRLTVEGFDMNNKKVRLRLRGYVGIVFQHEIDHLNGVLFIDRINAKDPLAPIPNAKPINFD